MEDNEAPPGSLANLYYGGQAVMEGVMIRGPQHMAVAVRHPKGHIVTHSEELSGIYTGRIRRVPLIRGVIVLWETLALGMRALAYSSKIALEEENEAGEQEPFPEKVFWGSIILAMVFVVGLFFAGPILLANLLEHFGWHRAAIVGVETVIRLAAFVGYIIAIGFMPDIRRVFQYHGAEHMTIHAYENGRLLVPDQIREYPKEHQRCGTSFLLVVIMVAMVTLFLFDLFVDEGLVIRVLSRIFLIPPIAALSYEILRFGTRFRSNPFVRAMFVPNILLQGLTTKKPDDEQIEVAIASFKAVLQVSGIPIPEPVAVEA